MQVSSNYLGFVNSVSLRQMSSNATPKLCHPDGSLRRWRTAIVIPISFALYNITCNYQHVLRSASLGTTWSIKWLTLGVDGCFVYMPCVNYDSMRHARCGDFILQFESSISFVVNP